MQRFGVKVARRCDLNVEATQVAIDHPLSHPFPPGGNAAGRIRAYRLAGQVSAAVLRQIRSSTHPGFHGWASGLRRLPSGSETKPSPLPDGPASSRSRRSGSRSRRHANAGVLRYLQQQVELNERDHDEGGEQLEEHEIGRRHRGRQIQFRCGFTGDSWIRSPPWQGSTRQTDLGLQVPCRSSLRGGIRHAVQEFA